MTKRFSQLPVANTFAAGDLVCISQGGVSKQIEHDKFISGIFSGIAAVTLGTVLFANGIGGAAGDAANLFWDNTNKRLGIGNAAPTVALDVTGAGKFSGALTIGGSLTLSGLTAGSVPFAGASGLISQDNSNLFWDNTNKRLGIGNAAPAMALDVTGAIRAIGGAAPASTTTGVSLWETGGNNVLISFVDTSRTANNKIADLTWNTGSFQIRFVDDAYSTVISPLVIQGGKAAGITGIQSNSGSGSWAHTGALSASVSVATPIVGTTTATDLAMQTNSTTRWLFKNSADLYPAGDNDRDIGAASARVRNGFFVGLVGTVTNDNAAAGNIGEIVSSTVVQGSAVSLTTGTVANVTSISLTAGDWDVSGATGYVPGATTNVTGILGGVSSTSATLGADGTYQQAAYGSGGLVLGNTIVVNANPTVRFSLSGTTTIFLIAQAFFTVSTMKAYGIIRARRVR